VFVRERQSGVHIGSVESAWLEGHGARPLELHPPHALKAGANRLFQLPRYVPQAAGFLRAPLQLKELKIAI
jgi:hypothetical protein